MSLGRAVHQKPGSPGRTERARGEASLDIDRDEARLARGEPKGLGRESLLGQALARENLVRAWQRVRANRGSAGADGLTVAETADYLKTHWPRIRDELRSGHYRPQPVRRVQIPKSGGGLRELGIPSVTDRLIQQALLQVLQPLIDPTFSAHSYGFRPGRKAHDAVLQAQRHVQAGWRVVVDVDLEKFFDRVNHDVLMDRLAKRIDDEAVLRLIRRYLNAGIMDHGVVMERFEGTPQGGPLSPLLANVLLDEVDRELEQRGHRFVRYADDFLIFTKTRRAAERVFNGVNRYLTTVLRLVVNLEKSRIVAVDGVEFLGFSFQGPRGTIHVSEKNVQRFKRRIRELTGRSRGISMPQRFAELRRHAQGWMGYFALAAHMRLFEKFDQWLRRRLRMCFWKRWRLVRTRVRNLLDLGVPRRQAFRQGDCAMMGSLA
jgi:group II intron reverse transcriptase/maturase